MTPLRMRSTSWSGSLGTGATRVRQAPAPPAAGAAFRPGAVPSSEGGVRSSASGPAADFALSLDCMCIVGARTSLQIS